MRSIHHGVERNTYERCNTGDKIEVHYRGTLEDGGKEFDASYNRGQPLSFHVGRVRSSRVGTKAVSIECCHQRMFC
jgi:FKBP-type peptidyl-prolyl cis-trans isomerase